MAFYNRGGYNNNAQLKPEGILEQAISLDSVGKAGDALTLMKPVFTARTGKPVPRTWTQSLEDLTIKFIELSVKTKSSSYDLRNTLTSFRASCVSTSLNAAATNHPQSVVRVVKYLLAKAESTINFQYLVIDPNDDDDDDETPESFAKLAFVENDTAQTSTAIQEQLKKNKTSASLRAYWDYYRIALDTIKPHTRSQQFASTPPPSFYPVFRTLYEEILRTALETCGKYHLSADFRRLTSRLRSSNDYKQQYQQNTNTLITDLLEKRESTQTALLSTLPHDFDQLNDTFSLILFTKLTQLNSAIALQSWVEISATFADITDVLGTISDPRSLCTPVVILIQLRFLDFLWQGGNTMLHACALKTLYDRLSTAQFLYNQSQQQQQQGETATATSTTTDYITELLQTVATKAKELSFPTTSWAFASLDTIKNGIILSTILAQSNLDQTTGGSTNDNNTATSSSSSSSTFGGLTTSAADLPLSALNTNNYYVTTAQGPSLNSLFAHATGVAAGQNADLVKHRLVEVVDPSFVVSQQGQVGTNIEVYKYFSLLTLDVEPTVQSLVDFIKVTFSTASPTTSTGQIFALFNHLNNKALTPLRLNRLISPHLAIITADVYLQQYTKPLYQTIVSTILFSLSNIYSIITLEKFYTLLPQSPYVDTADNTTNNNNNNNNSEVKTRIELESIITKISAQQNLSIKIDHQTASLHLRPFPRQIEQRVYSVLGAVTTAMDTIVKPTLQPILRPNDLSFASPEAKAGLYGALRDSIGGDVNRIRVRYVELQEKRKQMEEQARLDKERAEEAAKVAAEEKQRKQEEKLKEIQAKRQQELEQKAEEEAKAAKKKQMQEMVQKTALDAQHKSLVLTKDMKKQLAKLGGGDDDAAAKDMTEQDLIDLAKRVDLQKRREYVRLKKESKKMVDYTIRAMRSAQREELLKTQKEQKDKLTQQTEQAMEGERQKHRAQWEKDLAQKKRFAHIQVSRDQYKAGIMAERQKVYQVQHAEWKAKQDEIEAEKQRQEEAKREQEAKAAELKKQKDEERRRQDEEKRVALKETIGTGAADQQQQQQQSQQTQPQYQDDGGKPFKQQGGRGKYNDNNNNSGVGSKFMSSNTNKFMSSGSSSAYVPPRGGNVDRDERPPQRDYNNDKNNNNNNNNNNGDVGSKFLSKNSTRPKPQ